MNRKGITPVLATSLLILIAISAVATSAVFLRDTTDDLTESVNEDLSEDEMREGSEISIQYAYNNSDGDISVIVRNAGRYVLTVEEGGERLWDLYSDGRPQSFDYVGSPSPPVRLDPGQTITLDSNIEYPTSSPATLEIEGPYGVSASVICTSTDGQENC